MLYIIGAKVTQFSLTFACLVLQMYVPHSAVPSCIPQLKIIVAPLRLSCTCPVTAE